MYDAVTRTTYAELFKVAEAGLPGRLMAGLKDVIARHPGAALGTVGAAGLAAGGLGAHAIGTEVRDRDEQARMQSFMQGLMTGRQLGGMP